MPAPRKQRTFDVGHGIHDVADASVGAVDLGTRRRTANAQPRIENDGRGAAFEDKIGGGRAYGESRENALRDLHPCK